MRRPEATGTAAASVPSSNARTREDLTGQGPCGSWPRSRAQPSHSRATSRSSAGLTKTEGCSRARAAPARRQSTRSLRALPVNASVAPTCLRFAAPLAGRPRKTRYWLEGASLARRDYRFQMPPSSCSRLSRRTFPAGPSGDQGRVSSHAVLVTEIVAESTPFTSPKPCSSRRTPRCGSQYRGCEVVSVRSSQLSLVPG